MSTTNSKKYTIGIEYDKTSLKQLEEELKIIQNLTATQFRTTGSGSGGSLREASKELMRIKEEAKQVEKAIKDATNPNLNAINLTKFSQSINKIGIDKLANDFEKLGVHGSSAFRNLTATLISSNAKMKESHKLLNDMATSFKNTVKWGISSSIFNNMTGSLQKAWNYTKKLDKSLNDIRIVSGASADEMARFAVQANKAAMELGSSTKDYTDASLIYYQQGLNTDEVIERTNLTIKMANALGSSAKEVSDYMTAVWNNFAGGSETLEHYADVITALGASTASSSEEIAQGLEKFASIADTVGLSYEYATSALATVVAETRQSADTVGTAFKTLFARIQGLNLGETLDDGTTVNKYSEALEKVGINIKDSNDELKKMDTILNELGAKWKTLNSDQQVALAQTVAGVRQYNQLIALMDNWDTFGKNLQTAQSATGTLSRQQDTYMESTAAHLEKLGAATERLMSAFADKKGINELIDGLTSIVTLMSEVTESIGGGSNALLMLGSIGMQVFSTQIAHSLTTTINNLKLSKQGIDNLRQSLENANNLSKESTGITIISDEQINNLIEFKKLFGELVSSMNETEKNEGEKILQDLSNAYIDRAKLEESIGNAIKTFGKINPNYSSDDIDELAQNPFGAVADVEAMYSEHTTQLKNAQDAINAYDSAVQKMEQDEENFIYIQGEAFENVITALKNLNNEISSYDNRYLNIIDEKELEDIERVRTQLDGLLKMIELYKSDDAEKNPLSAYDLDEQKDMKIALNAEIRNTAENLKGQFKDAADIATKKIREMNNAIGKEGKKAYKERREEAEKNVQEAENEANQYKDSMGQDYKTKQLVDFTAAAGQAVSSLRTLVNLWSIFNNDQLSTGEKILQIFSNLLIALPMLSNAIKTMHKDFGAIWSGLTDIGPAMKNAFKSLGEFILKTLTSAKTKDIETASIEANTKALEKNNKARQGESVKNSITKAAGGTGSKIATQGITNAATGTAVTGGAAAGAGVTSAATTGGAAAGTGAIVAGVATFSVAVVVIAALVYGIIKLVEWWNKDADAAKAAALQVENLTEAYNECKAKADNLKQSIEDYNNSVKALENLVEGTKEFEDAIDSANEKAKALIETYKLYDQYTIDKNGLIVINEEALKNAQNKADNDAARSQRDLYAAKITNNQAQNRSIATNISRKTWTGDVNSEGELAGIRLLSNEEITHVAEVLNQMGDAALKSDDAFRAAILSSTDLTESEKIASEYLVENRKELIAFGDSLSEAEKANKYYAKQIAGIEIKDKYGNDATEMSKNNKGEVREGLKNQILEAMNSKVTEQNTELEEKLKGIDISSVKNTGDLSKWLENYDAGYTVSNDKELAKEYMKRVLHWDESVSSTQDKWGKSVLNNADTGTSVTMTDTDMRKALAKQAEVDFYTQKYGSSLNLDDFNKALDKLIDGADEFGEKYGSDFTSSLLESLSSGDLDKLNFSEVFKELDPKEWAEVNSLTEDEILEMLHLSAEDLANLGFSSSEAFYKAWKSGMDQYSEDQWAQEQIQNSDKLSGPRAQIVQNLFSDNADSIESTEELKTEAEKIESEHKDYVETLRKMYGDAYRESTEYLQLMLEAQQQLEDSGLKGAFSEEVDAIGYAQGALEAYKDSLGELPDYYDSMEGQIYDFVYNQGHAWDELSEEQKKYVQSLPAGIDTNKFSSLVEESEKSLNDFRKSLIDLVDQEYVIKLKIENDAQSDFDNIIALQDQIAEGAGMIGENYIVAAEDIEELNDAFPGILKNATILADGTMQLNSEVAESAMAAAQESLQADTDATVEKMKNQQAELEARREIANNILQVAKSAAAGKIDTETAAAKIGEQLDALEILNSQSVADEEKTDSMDVTDTAVVNSEKMANSMAEAYKKMADDSAKWAEASKDNILVGTTGVGKVRKVNISSTFKSSVGAGEKKTTGTNNEIKSADEITNSTDWNAVISTYEGMVKSYDTSINNIQGKIGEILARNANTRRTLYNAGKGRGNKGGSSPEADNMEYIDGELDLYERVNVELNEISNNLKKLQSQEDHLKGADLVKNLNEQIKTLNSQIDRTSEKMSIAMYEASLYRQELASYGAVFGADGDLENYADLFISKQNQVNSIIDRYNSMSKAEQDNFKPTVEAAKAEWESFLKAYEKYDELISSTIPEYQQEILDITYDKISKQLQQFNLEIELRVNIDEVKKSWSEFKAEVIDGIEEKNILGNALLDVDRFKEIYSENGVVATELKYLDKMYNELDMMKEGKTPNWFGADGITDPKAWQDQLAEHVERLQEYILEAHQLMDDLENKENESLQNTKSLESTRKSMYDASIKNLQHNIKLIQLLYSEKAYSYMSDYYNAIENTYKTQYEADKASTEYWKTQMDAAEMGSEIWETAKENWMSAADQEAQSLEAYIQSITDSYINSIKTIFEEMHEQLTNGKGLDYIQEEWELINKEADQYLDTINAQYGIQELQNKYLDAINDNSNLAIQERLTKLMNEQVDSLKTQDKLSQYDLDRANKKYEIALKQIELEEAQYNKSTMRLNRDSQGNYTYQYVADEDQLNSLQNELSNLYNELYNLDVDKYKENLETISNYTKECEEKIIEILTNSALSQEEKEEQILLLREHYAELTNSLLEDNEEIQHNLRESTYYELVDLYGKEADVIKQFLEDEESVMEQMVFGWNSGIQDMVSAIKDEGGFEQTLGQALDRIREKTLLYNDALNGLKPELEDIKDGHTETTSEVEELILTTDALIETSKNETEQIKNNLIALENWAKGYDLVTNSLSELIKAYNTWTELSTKDADDIGAEVDNIENTQSNTEVVPPLSTPNIVPQEVIPNPAPTNPYAWMPLGGKEYVIQSGDNLWSIAKRFYGKGSRYTEIWNNNKDHLRGRNANQIWPGEVLRLNTGGYTGDWAGSDGRMAMLHKKELVLNATDTENLLNAVSIIREVTSAMNSSLLSRLAGNITGFGASSNELAQNVHIEASFPNVTNHNEIEEALNNLVNAAAQKVQEK